MSDAIYEVQLVGQELRAFEQLHGVRVSHYLLVDGRTQAMIPTGCGSLGPS